MILPKSISSGILDIALSETSPDSYPLTSLHGDLNTGVSAVVRAMSDGVLTEEQATDFIKILVSAYVGAVVTQQVESYLEDAILGVLSHQNQGDKFR